MDVGEMLRVETAAEWRSWLAVHHSDRREIWQVNDRKGPNRRTPDYSELVDEAVCFGWIDGLVRGLDERSYLLRWTPRRRGSKWTSGNLERARRLVSEGRMTAAGLASVPDDVRVELQAP